MVLKYESSLLFNNTEVITAREHENKRTRDCSVEYRRRRLRSILQEYA